MFSLYTKFILVQLFCKVLIERPSNPFLEPISTEQWVQFLAQGKNDLSLTGLAIIRLLVGRFLLLYHAAILNI